MKKLLLTLGLMVVAAPVAGLGAASAATTTTSIAGALAHAGDAKPGADESKAQRRSYRNRRVQQERRECRRELRRAENRRQFNRELAECRRELNRARQSGRWDRWDSRWRGW